MKRFVSLVGVLVAGGASAQQMLPPVIDHSTYRAGAEGQSRAATNQVMYDLLDRVDQLQRDVQRLHGQIEEQAQLIEELRHRQENIYNDIDQRLNTIENDVSQRIVNPVENLPPASPSEPALTGSSPVAPAMGIGRGGSSELSPAPASGAETTEPPTTPVAAASSAPTPAPVPAAPPTDEKTLYQQAYDTLRNGQTSRAIGLFQQLAEQFPAGQYAANAWYWLGEAHKLNHDNKASRQAFDTLIARYPQSPKVPDAKLKLGFIEFEQGNTQKARELFSELIKSYPGSTAAHLAEKRLQQMGGGR